MTFGSTFIATPAEAADLAHAFYIIETDSERIEEAIPAYSAQLIVMVRGRTRVTFATGDTGESSTVFFNAPQLRSAECVLHGPVLGIGVSLTHIAWQRLSNLPADAVHDRMVAADRILSPEQIAAIEADAAACDAGEITPEALCNRLAGVLAAAARHRLRPDQVAVVEAILAWLASGFDPALDELYARVDVSARQVQRLCRRFFGVPPAQVLKRFRALRAAMLLANPSMDTDLRDQLMAGFFDQAHLIRDIRRYTGRTPTQLRQQSLARNLLDPTAHGDAGAPLRDAAA